MHEGEPFKKSLQDSKYSDKIKLLENAPDKMVRRYVFHAPRFWIELKRKFTEGELLDFLKNHQEEIRIESHKAFEEKLSEFKRGINIFHTLKEKYQIAVPKMDIVFARDEENGIPGMDKNLVAYTLVDKIIGENLEDIQIIPLEAKEKIDDFYLNILQYYIDTYQNGGDWWQDFRNRQIMYGHKKDEIENRVYIVDVDPCFSTLTKEEMRKSVGNKLLGELSYIFFLIKRVESKFSPPQKLTHARQKIHDAMITFQEDIYSSFFGKENFEELKERLRE